MLLKKRPELSIVVIIHNKKEYIRECLDSILSQDVDKEVVCIDDFSTDGTFEILKEYESKYKEVKVYQNEENYGTTRTRYEGLSKANGEYAVMVDADDILIPNTFKKIMEEVKESNADIFEYSVDSDCKDEEYKKSLKKEKKFYDSDLLYLYKERIISNVILNKIVSRKTYKKALSNMNMDINYPNFSDVVYFLYHFLSNAETLASTDTVGYFYYDYRGMTATIDEVNRFKMHRDFEITRDELVSIYGKSECLKEIFNRACNQAVASFINLSEKDQKKYMPDLYDMMGKKNANFLITAHKQYKEQKSSQL